MDGPAHDAASAGAEAENKDQAGDTADEMSLAVLGLAFSIEDPPAEEKAEEAMSKANGLRVDAVPFVAPQRAAAAPAAAASEKPRAPHADGRAAAGSAQAVAWRLASLEAHLAELCAMKNFGPPRWSVGGRLGPNKQQVNYFTSLRASNPPESIPLATGFGADALEARVAACQNAIQAPQFAGAGPPRGVPPRGAPPMQLPPGAPPPMGHMPPRGLGAPPMGPTPMGPMPPHHLHQPPHLSQRGVPPGYMVHASGGS